MNNSRDNWFQKCYRKKSSPCRDTGEKDCGRGKVACLHVVAWDGMEKCHRCIFCLSYQNIYFWYIVFKICIIISVLFLLDINYSIGHENVMTWLLACQLPCFMPSTVMRKNSSCLPWFRRMILFTIFWLSPKP